MGTRSLTKFIETYKDDKGKVKKQTLTTVYRQMDGYPSGMGNDLAKFLSKGKLVNGIGGDQGLVFNGMGCLAAQVIKELKDGPGNIYIYPAKAAGCGEEYTYEVIGDNDTHTLRLKCYEVNWKTGRKGKLIFEGDPAECLKKIKTLKD
jgi:hypothetical protein